MKISEMTTDRAADVLVMISEPVSRIAEDQGIVDALKAFAQGKNSEKAVMSVIGSAVSKFTPVLLKDHRADLYVIVAALADKTIEEVAKQTIIVTMQDIRESIDKDLIDFFRSAKQ